MKMEDLKKLAIAGMIVAASNPVSVSAVNPLEATSGISYLRHGCCYGYKAATGIAVDGEVEEESSLNS